MARKWTAEQKAAQRQRMLDKHAKDGQIAKVASIAGTSKEDVAKLIAEVADLKKQLKVSETKRSEAELEALRMADAQGSYLAPIPVEEVPTGKQIEVMVLNPEDPYRITGHRDDGRDILRPNFIKKKVPTFFYKIWMPPVGGTDLKLNGDAYYHGTVYEFDIDTLRSVKDIVYRTWAHDKAIHNDEENAYRRPLNINAATPGALQAAISATSQRLRG